MSKADVIALVHLLSARADSATVDQYYEDVLYELGRIGQTMQVAIIETTEHDATYDLPADNIEIVGLIYDDRQLHPASVRDIEAHSSTWREERGRPTDYVTEFESTETFRLYPAPDAPGKPFIWTGNTFGTDYPPFAVAAIYQQKRDEVAEYFDLYVALAILGREFSRDSDHRDLPYAQACQQLASLILRMIL